ncbi:MAG: hypothetical protein U0269_28540 [Polyangiales bacterium]
MNRTRVLSVLSALALLGSTANCGQSVRPEFLDGADDDGALDERAPNTPTTTMPVCRTNADRALLLNQRCASEGARLCRWDVCIELECRHARVPTDGGFVVSGELRWGQRLVCNGPLAPPELEA